MSEELATQYDPKAIEGEIYRRWQGHQAFDADPDARERPYVIMMPLPNVTGALHMGHAMDNVMQDLLTRWHRMRGENTLWMPGTDHAGIATQAVVEKRLFELEGKTRHDLGREGLVKRIWEWKEQYQRRIVSQQQAMGCSCDWRRQRFTMDGICQRAVYETFFRMFRDGLIYRGDRLVNWDCHLQTAVADDEIVAENVAGHFWHLRYPVIDPQPGEPTHVIVATTRPETMLGDTAVACHPDPQGALDKLLAQRRAGLSQASEKEQVEIRRELEGLEERRRSHLPLLLKLREMALAGRQLRLPLQERPIPLICDEWAKPELGSGCVKITPAHDPNDYEVWGRHRREIGIVNILNGDGTLNANAGAYAGLDRFKARAKVVADLEARGLVAEVEDRQISIGHSDRSKTPIEPYLSKQWFVRMGDLPGGIVCGRGTAKEFKAPGLAQAAMDAVEGPWRSPSGLKLAFHPDERYAKTYLSWLGEKRDWCISRQLWWGHRIPIWRVALRGSEAAGWLEKLQPYFGNSEVAVRLGRADGESRPLTDRASLAGLDPEGEYELLVCLRIPSREDLGTRLEALGLVRDPDVLDTWFSSALWPHSTLGWPDPESAGQGKDQAPLGAQDGNRNCLEYYYPGSCLVTGRDIITLWVARMVMAGLYNLGELPFRDCFIHANIQDGKGVRMSKSKGNGVDPLDIIDRYGTDAMRYVLCELQSGSQDIRLPVQAVSPYTGNLIDLATAKHGRTQFTYLCPETKKEFDVLGSMEGVPAAKLISERFDVGRNFCNKLWNAARFAFLNLEGAPVGARGASFTPLTLAQLPLEDRWILSRLAWATAEVNRQLEAYNPAAAIGAAREFFWSELCDWYLEFIKPRMREAAQATVARQVLAAALDQVLRLLHPFVPFITEALWRKLNELEPMRGIEAELPGCEKLLILADWPKVQASWRDEALEARMALLQGVTRGIRDVRARYAIPPNRELAVTLKASGDLAVEFCGFGPLIANLARLERLEVNPQAQRAADAASVVAGGVECYIHGVIDLEKEKQRLGKQREQLGKGIDGARKKLENQNFLQRAEPAVVARERSRLQEMEQQLAALEENLRVLGG